VTPAWIGEGVELQGNVTLSCLPVLSRNPFDPLEHAAAHSAWGDHQAAIGMFPGVPGQRVEEHGDVRGDGWITGQEREVGVDARGRRIVVAGAEMNISGEPVILTAHNQAHLGMGLQPDQSVRDVHTRPLQFFGPLNIVFFVEAGPEFDQRGDLFPVFPCLHESFHDG